MSEYQRIRLINGKAYIVDDEGNKIDPDTARDIMDALSNTVDEPCYVYLGYSDEKALHKIGISNDPERRAKELGVAMIATMKCDMWGQYSAREFEKLFHRMFTLLGFHESGEWFNLPKFYIEFMKSQMFLVEQGHKVQIYQNLQPVVEDLKWHTENEFSALLYYDSIISKMIDETMLTSHKVMFIFHMQIYKIQAEKSGYTRELPGIIQISKAFIKDVIQDYYRFYMEFRS